MGKVAFTAYPETANTKAVTTTDDLKRAIYAKVPENERWRTYYGRGMNLDRIEIALRQATQGFMRDLCDLSRETMLMDPHLSATVVKRINSVANFDYQIVPATGPGVNQDIADKIADYVRSQISRIPRYQHAIRQLAWGLFDGRAGLEVQWIERQRDGTAPQQGNMIRGQSLGDSEWLVAELCWVHPRRISFGPERELRIVDSLYSGYGFDKVGVAMRDFPYKFVEFKPQLFGDYPEREGLGPRTLYWSFFKRFGARERMILLELFGKPWKIIEVDKDWAGDTDDLAAADTAIDQLGSKTSARLPRGAKLNVPSPAKGAGEVHSDVLEYSDGQISKLVLGQTGTTDAVVSGLNSGQAYVMSDEFLTIVMGDASLIAESLEDGLTDAIVALNYGLDMLTHAPRVVPKAELPRDWSKEATRVDAALKTGAALAVDEVYEVMGFRKPTEKDDKLRYVTDPSTGNQHAIVEEADKNLKAAEKSVGGAGESKPDAAAGGGTNTNLIGVVDMKSVVTVNEARQARGLGPLQLPPPGGDDPDGYLVVSVYDAKHAPAPAPFGGGPSAPPDPTAPPKDEPPAAPPGKGPQKPGGEPAPGAKAAEPPPAEKPEEAPKKPGKGLIPGLLAASKGSAEPIEELFENEAELLATSASLFGSAIVALEGKGAAARAHRDAHSVELSGKGEKAAQPATVHGTLETIIDRGTKEASRVTQRWGEMLAAACAGLTRPAQIKRALTRAGGDLPIKPLAAAIERRVSHGAMTGALDSAWEGENDEHVKPESFPAPESASASKTIRLVGTEGEVGENPAFTESPYKSALRYFSKKQPVSKDRWARLTSAAKSRAFTMAGQASEHALEVAHDELTKQILNGGDLKEFGKALTTRFESAGLSVPNPSHLETIFRTNVLDAYNVGRKAEMSEPAVLKARPYWVVRGVVDSRQRKTHGAINGWIFRADDPWFQSPGGPPWGFNCRDRLSSIRPELAKGKQIRSGAEVRGLPDKGFEPTTWPGL